MSESFLLAWAAPAGFNHPDDPQYMTVVLHEVADGEHSEGNPLAEGEIEGDLDATLTLLGYRRIASDAGDADWDDGRRCYVDPWETDGYEVAAKVEPIG